MYLTEYRTPTIGTLTLASDGTGVTGCWFNNGRYFGYGVNENMERNDSLAVFDQARKWLDRYFAGETPDPRELTLTARAVGGAVGHNPLCLIVPCHRVIGSNGSLTGFGGGIDTKVRLLEHEGAMRDGFWRPKRGTAL